MTCIFYLYLYIKHFVFIQAFHAVKALRVNAHQLKKYLVAYYNYSSDFPLNTYYELDDMFSTSERDLQYLVTNMVKGEESKDTLQQIKRLQYNYETYISTIRSTFQGIWAKFDLTCICIGIMSLVISLLLNCYLVQMSCDKEAAASIPSTVFVLIILCVVYIVYAAFQCFVVGETLSSFMAYLLGCAVIIFTLVLMLNSKTVQKDEKDFMTTVESKLRSKDVFSNFFNKGLPLIICIFFFFSRFSNSFLVYEETMTLFFTQTMIWMYCIKILFNILQKPDTSSETKSKRNKTKSRDFMYILTHPALLTFYTTLVLSTCVRLSMTFKSCREEQVNCNITMFISPISSFTGEMEWFRNVRYFCSVACLFLLVTCGRRIMNYLGNMNGYALSVICFTYIIPMSATCTALYWALQTLPQKVFDDLPVWQQTCLPKTVYILTIVSLLVAVCKPLCIFTVYRNKNSVPDENNVIPHLYKKYKKSFQQDKSEEEEEEKPALVYGLGSAFSSAVVNLYTIVCVLLVLLLGDGLAPSVLLMTASIFFFLELHATEQNTRSLKGKIYNTDTVTACLVCPSHAEVFQFSDNKSKLL